MQLAHWDLDEKRSNENEIVIYSPVTLKRLKISFKKHEKFLLKNHRLRTTP